MRPTQVPARFARQTASPPLSAAHRWRLASSARAAGLRRRTLLPAAVVFCRSTLSAGSGSRRSRLPLAVLWCVEPVQSGSVRSLLLVFGQAGLAWLKGGCSRSDRWPLLERANTRLQLCRQQVLEQTAVRGSPVLAAWVNCGLRAPFQSSGQRFRTAPRPSGRCLCGRSLFGVLSSAGLVWSARGF